MFPKVLPKTANVKKQELAIKTDTVDKPKKDEASETETSLKGSYQKLFEL